MQRRPKSEVAKKKWKWSNGAGGQDQRAGLHTRMLLHDDHADLISHGARATVIAIGPLSDMSCLRHKRIQFIITSPIFKLMVWWSSLKPAHIRNSFGSNDWFFKSTHDAVTSHSADIIIIIIIARVQIKQSYTFFILFLINLISS